MSARLTGTELRELARFMAHVETNSGPFNTCWQWTGNRPDGRYGHFSVAGQAVKAHRWIYGLLCEPIPENLVLRHRCDNPACVYPLHLEPGTLSQNTQDAVLRGRWSDRRGEKHPLSVLTEAQVLEIRRRAAMGVRQSSIAEAFEISRAQVGKIVRRENWRHV